jgi:hypothetical protein
VADFPPQRSIRAAPPAAHPVACDGCGRVGQITDGRLPDGWTAEELPSCQWPFALFFSCPGCVRESGAALNRTTGAA